MGVGWAEGSRERKQSAENLVMYVRCKPSVANDNRNVCT